MVDSLILTPALPCTQNHLLISADLSSCTASQTQHAQPPTRSQRLCYREEDCSQTYRYIYGYNYSSDGKRGEQGRAGELLNLFALQRQEALLRWRGEHSPRVLIPSAMHRQAPSITHSHPLSCRLLLLSLKVFQLSFLMHSSPSFLPVCQVLITSLSQLL